MAHQTWCRGEVTGLFLLRKFRFFSKAQQLRFGHSFCNIRFASIALAHSLTKLRHQREKQHYKVVFHLMPATKVAVSSSHFQAIKKNASLGGFFNGGSDGARTRDLLRDRQTL